MSITRCPFCNNKRLCELRNNYKKCSACNKKFSVRKVEADLKIIEYFCNNLNANKASKLLNKNYRTIQNRYMIFRKLIANYLENEYYELPRGNSPYEEFHYFTDRKKRNKKKSFYEAINIIGFYSNKRIYTLLMPRLNYLQDEVSLKSYEDYLRWHKLSSRDSYMTSLCVFWKYLEENLKKYKGVDEKNFFFYLKECEFKFNYLQNEQIDILKEIYFK